MTNKPIIENPGLRNDLSEKSILIPLERFVDLLSEKLSASMKIIT
jgi:hypothetical protein